MAAEDAEKAESTAESARVLVEAVSSRLLPRQILTRKAFENAIAVVMAIGGSTNAVLHLWRSPTPPSVPLDLDDFERIRAQGAGALRPQALGAATWPPTCTRPAAFPRS